MFDNCGAEPRQRLRAADASLTSPTIASAAAATCASGGGAGRGLRAFLRSQRPLPQGDSVDAGKAEVPLTRSITIAARCCNSSAKPLSTRTTSVAGACSVRAGLAARRPFQRQRLRHGREPLADDILPIKDDLRLAETLPGKDRVDNRIDKIGQRRDQGPRTQRRGNEAGVLRHAPL